MKTLHHDDQARRPKREEPGRAKRLAAAFAAATVLVSAPLALTSCGPDCPVNEGCDTRDFDLSLAQGDERETMTDGSVLKVKVLEIIQTVAPDGAVTCRVTNSGARINLRVETDPPWEQEMIIGPGMCFALASSCMSIHDVEVTQDIGPLDSDTGTCEITNSKVNFTLEIGR